MRPAPRRPANPLLPAWCVLALVILSTVIHPELARPWFAPSPTAQPTSGTQGSGPPYGPDHPLAREGAISGGSGAGNTSTTTCSGVTDNGNGTFSYSLLHTDRAGIVRDAANCPVVLNGFNWAGSSNSSGNNGGSGLSMAQTDLVFSTFHTQYGANIWRIYVNSLWWVNNVAMPTPISPTYPTYQLWIAHLVNDAYATGAYALLVPDTLFPELPNCHMTVNSTPNVDCASQDQGNRDYNGTVTPPGCTTACTGGPVAQYLNNPYTCFDGAVITSTAQMLDALATTYSVSPSVLFGTWNEVKDGQCGRTMNTDPDQTGTGGRVVYQDNSALIGGYTVPSADQPYWNTSTPFGAWFDHQSVLIDYIRHRDPTALVFVGGPAFSNSFCPIAGNPNTGDSAHCGGGGAPVSTGTQNAVLTHRFTQGNIVEDLHQYPGGYMVNLAGTNFPTRIDNEMRAVHALGYGGTFNEYGGGSPPADALCYIINPARAHHMGLVYFEPNNLEAAGNINGSLTPNALGSALAADYAYLRGDSGAVTTALEADNSTPCPALYAVSQDPLSAYRGSPAYRSSRPTHTGPQYRTPRTTHP